jgi:hypothetical protein
VPRFCHSHKVCSSDSAGFRQLPGQPRRSARRSFPLPLRLRTPRCRQWHLDNQLCESLNSSIRLQIQSSPSIGLPLLSGRLLIKRTFSAWKRRGQQSGQSGDVLAELEHSHPFTIDWKRAGGESARHRTPEIPSPQDLPPLPCRRQPPGGTRSSAQAAAAAVCLALFAAEPRARRPDVKFALAFLRRAPLLSTMSELWMVATTHYTQVWCVRAAMVGDGESSGSVRVPVEVRKLLDVVADELEHSDGVQVLELDFQSLHEEEAPLSCFRIAKVVHNLPWPAPRSRVARGPAASSGGQDRRVSKTALVPLTRSQRPGESSLVARSRVAFGSGSPRESRDFGRCEAVRAASTWHFWPDHRVRTCTRKPCSCCGRTLLMTHGLRRRPGRARQQ